MNSSLHSMPEVRESAGLAFSTLYKSAGMQAIDEIVPTLLHALEDDETSDMALDDFEYVSSAFNAHALGALAEVAGPGLNFHLGTILPALLSAMGAEDEDVQTLAKEAAETVALVIDEEGVEDLIAELLKGVGDTLALIRSSSYLIGFFFKYNKLYMVDEAPNMISTLIILLSDSDSSTVEVAWEALSRVIGSVPKEVLPSYIKLVRDAVSTSKDKEQGKRSVDNWGGPVVIPGFCLPKALQPLLLIFLQGLTSGSAELREQAALGLGELIEVTSEKALKDFVIPIIGPLIRIIGDRFPWQVKSAILSTLSILIRKGGMSLRPFLPQLQTTFIKCLQDSTRTVRTSAAFALGKLSALSTRVDPLVSDLLSSLQASDAGVREAILTALKGVLKHAGKSVSDLVSVRVFSQLKDLIHHDDDQVRISTASILGITSQKRWKQEYSKSAGFQLQNAVKLHDKHGRGDHITPAIVFISTRSYCINIIIGPAFTECLKDSSTLARLATERCAVHAFQMTKGTDHVQAAQKFITGLGARGCGVAAMRAKTVKKNQQVANSRLHIPIIFVFFKRETKEAFEWQQKSLKKRQSSKTYFFIMEREKQLSILYQKTRSGNPFSSKATCEQRLQKENDDLQHSFSKLDLTGAISKEMINLSSILFVQFLHFVSIPWINVGIVVFINSVAQRTHEPETFNFPLGTFILPALLSAMGAEDEDVRNTLAKEAAETVALGHQDEEGVEDLIAELLKALNRSSSFLIGFFFKYNKLYMVDEAPNMISYSDHFA
ncbi:hypothetical protein NC652_036709 [Populus alba x Populus x berolinensis]|nr:hypothetical protein NC652_036709 [Populus alba x Populus x berolinensis]